MENTKQIVTAKELFSTDDIKKKFQEILGARAGAFMTSVLQVVGSSQLLKKADPNSVYNAAAVAATLDLPLNNSLGFAYIIPYKTRVKIQGSSTEVARWDDVVVAQFQIGYKGFIQLAQRSGQYKTIAATAIREGQLVSSNPLTGFVFDFEKQIPADAKIIGYASYFRLINGFEKTWYMTVEQLAAHGKRFSKSYDNKDGLWKTDPETMSLKTVLKLLISKFGPMSVDMQKAITVDQAVINNADTLDIDYTDNDKNKSDSDPEYDRLSKMIEAATTVMQLDPLREHADLEQTEMITRKEIEILRKLPQVEGIADRIAVLEKSLAQ